MACFACSWVRRLWLTMFCSFMGLPCLSREPREGFSEAFPGSNPGSQSLGGSVTPKQATGTLSTREAKGKKQSQQGGSRALDLIQSTGMLFQPLSHLSKPLRAWSEPQSLAALRARHARRALPQLVTTAKLRGSAHLLGAP